MVEGMSVVVNLMLSLTSVMESTTCLVRPIGVFGGVLMVFLI